MDYIKLLFLATDEGISEQIPFVEMQDKLKSKLLPASKFRRKNMQHKLAGSLFLFGFGIKIIKNLRSAALVAVTAMLLFQIPTTPAQGNNRKPDANDRAYVLTTIGVPDATMTQAYGINAGGDIVGSYKNAAGFHGFLLSAGEFITLDYPGDNILSTVATAIGPAGDIVGQYSLKNPAPAGNVHGFLRTREGEWSTVDYPVGNHLMQGGLYSILPDGTMLGCFHDGTAATTTAMYGYVVYPDGTTAEFDYPTDQPFSMFYGATPNGKTIVGAYRTGTGPAIHWHGYLLDDHGIITLDVPGSVLTQAYSINPAGETVGTYSAVNPDGTTGMHGFLVETRGLTVGDWQFTTIDFPGAIMTHVRGINAGSDLVGDYIILGNDGKLQTKGFLASRPGR
jgi:hypothetical protein